MNTTNGAGKASKSCHITSIAGGLMLCKLLIISLYSCYLQHIKS